MTRRRTPITLIALVLVSSMVATVAVPAVAQSNTYAAEALVEKIKGKREKFGKTRVGDWVAITDGEADVRTRDGAIEPDAEGWGDIKRVLITQSKLPRKLVKEWDHH